MSRPREITAEKVAETAMSDETRTRFLELYGSGMSAKKAGEEAGISDVTGLKWAHEAGIARSRSEAIRLHYRKNPRPKKSKPAPKPPRPVGIDYRTLERYERTMPFQQAVEKTLAAWCPA